MSLSGHFWTIWDLARRELTEPVRGSGFWRGRVDDPRRGEVVLSGLLDGTNSERMVVIVHGLGGSAQSRYAAQAAAACVDRGWSALRLNMRGSDLSGEDYYHAGLTADLHAALASPELTGYRHLALWGFSLGGHLALSAATEQQLDRRVRAVAAVSAPLDLEACCRTIDQRSRWPYRRYMLNHLLEIYAAVARRGEVPVPLRRVRRARGFREFDGLVVAPRFGFDSAEDYYRKASVGPRLGGLRIRTLYVGSLQDPVVPPSAVQPYLADGAQGVDSRMTVRWADRGGHVGFPRDLDLGEPAARGIYSQVASWLDRQTASRRDGG